MRLFTVTSHETHHGVSLIRVMVVTVADAPRAVARFEAKFGSTPDMIVTQGLNLEDKLVSGVFNREVLERILELEDGFVELSGEFTADLT